jgi:peptidylprolyl isomerase
MKDSTTDPMTIFAGIILMVIAGGGLYWYSTSRDKAELATGEKQEEVTEAPTGLATGVTTTATTTPTMNDTQTPQNIKSATFTTSMGTFTLELFTDTMPVTTENFISLASKGFYNGTKFHRIIDGFMIQGGDPLTKDDAQVNRWGTGGPGYSIKDEFTGNHSNVVGTISMANAGPNTGGSQFFINVADNTFLDGKHPVFGKVVAGMDVVEKIVKTKTNESDRPVTPVIIESVVLK